MGILDKAKQVSGKAVEKVMEFSSDELIADTIIKAVKKQENVNALLKSKGSNYRIADLDLQIGVPPTVVFGIRRLHEGEHSLSTEESPESLLALPESESKSENKNDEKE